MQALMLDGDGHAARALQRTALAGPGAPDEKWLQALLFEHPKAIPIDLIDPGARMVVPICRELAIPKDGTTVFLDLLGVTPLGRLVLVECKLWRNPQARREVIAQILEYGALLRRWTYADLTARLKAALRWTGGNPLFDHVRRQVPALDEARFVDAVARSLAAGDFDLIVAGDGIRSDLHAITTHLNMQGGLAARLALVEFQLWSDADGRTLVVPALALRTEVVQQRVIIGGDGMPIRLELPAEAMEEVEAAIDPGHAAERDRNRAFWQRFIDELRFDHPDQPPPRHGGNNWVRIELPSPAKWMTAFRGDDRAGLFLTLNGDAGAAAFDSFEVDAAALQTETELALSFDREREHPFKGTIGTSLPRARKDAMSAGELQTWLSDAANRMVSAFRPRLSAITRGT
jgi:hypothetical protein